MSETIGQILSSPIVTTTLLGLGVALVGAWLAATWWAFQDASRRAESELPRWVAAAWVLLSTPILLPFSLGIYALLRPQEVAGERRTRLLVAALQASEAAEPSCPACGDAVHPAWARCPACSLWLGRRCDRCEALAPVDAQLCPWCAWELEVDEPALQPEPIPAPAATAPAGIPAAPAGVPAPAAAAGARAFIARHERAPGHGLSREDETVAWAGGPVEA